MTAGTIPLALIRRALEDAWSWREQLAEGYWCSECDQQRSGRCDRCQEDVDAMREYEQALDGLDGAS